MQAVWLLNVVVDIIFFFKIWKIETLRFILILASYCKFLILREYLFRDSIVLYKIASTILLL